MTQQELADKAGISRTYLSNLERGESMNPTWQVVARISKALDKAMPPLQEGQVLDSGYQILCRVTNVEFTEVFDWLSVLLGYKFETGEIITGIDSFQVIGGSGPYYHCIAVCRVANQEQ